MKMSHPQIALLWVGGKLVMSKRLRVQLPRESAQCQAGCKPIWCWCSRDSVMDRNPVQLPFSHRGEPELRRVVCPVWLHSVGRWWAFGKMELSKEMERMAESLQQMSNVLFFFFCVIPPQRLSAWYVKKKGVQKKDCSSYSMRGVMQPNFH